MLNNHYPLKEDTGAIIQLAYEINKTLGTGLLEIVYKDAFELEFSFNNIPFQREKEFTIVYKKIILPHKFYADFIIKDSILLEVKARENGIRDADLAQTINYLRLSDCPVGLIINFSKEKFQIKRVVI